MRRGPDGRRRFRVAGRRDQFRQRPRAGRDRFARRDLQHRRPLERLAQDRPPAGAQRAERGAADPARSDRRPTCAIANWCGCVPMCASPAIFRSPSAISPPTFPRTIRKSSSPIRSPATTRRRPRNRTPKCRSSPAILPRSRRAARPAPAVTPAVCDLNSLLPKVKTATLLPLDDVLTRVRDVAASRRHGDELVANADGTPSLEIGLRAGKRSRHLFRLPAARRARERHAVAEDDDARSTAAAIGASAWSSSKRARRSARSCANSAPRPTRSRPSSP